MIICTYFCCSGREANNAYTLWVCPLDSRNTEVRITHVTPRDVEKHRSKVRVVLILYYVFLQDSLRNIFSHYGQVTDVKIVYPKSGASPFGYVTYKTQA